MHRSLPALLLLFTPFAHAQIDPVTYKRFRESFTKMVQVRGEAESAMQRLRAARTAFWAMDASNPGFAAARDEYEEALLAKDLLLIQMDVIEGVDMQAGNRGDFTKAGRVALGNLDGGVHFIARHEFGEWSPRMQIWQNARAKESADLPKLERAMFTAWAAYTAKRDAAEYLFENPQSPLKSNDPREFLAAVWLSHGEAATMEAARADVRALEQKYGAEPFTKLIEAMPILVAVHPRSVSPAGHGPTAEYVNHGFRAYLDTIVKDVDSEVAAVRARTDIKAIMAREDAATREALAVMKKAAARGAGLMDVHTMEFVGMRWRQGRFQTSASAPEVPYEALFSRYLARLCKEYAISSLRRPDQQAAKAQLEELLSFISVESAPKPTRPPEDPKSKGPFNRVRDLLPDLVPPVQIGDLAFASGLVETLERQHEKNKIEDKLSRNSRQQLDQAISQYRKWLESGGPECAAKLRALEEAHKIYLEQFAFIPTLAQPAPSPQPAPASRKRR